MSGREERRLRVNPITHRRSVELRKNATHPEKVLWHAVRNRQLAGLKFRRQNPVGRYIVDFCCMKARLAIELDGESHEGHQDYDARRRAFVESEGYRVLRFTNDQVLSNLDGVLEAIRVAAVGNAAPSPSPSLREGDAASRLS
ncbi:MAG: endonuclease domain-containing protein [Planctomycetota bacterium]